MLSAFKNSESSAISTILWLNARIVSARIPKEGVRKRHPDWSDCGSSKADLA
jgi:hypothetical protein